MLPYAIAALAAVLSIMALRKYIHIVQTNVAVRNDALKQFYRALDEVMAYETLPAEALQALRRDVQSVQNPRAFNAFAKVVKEAMRYLEDGKRMPASNTRPWISNQPEHVRERIGELSFFYLVALSTIKPLRGTWLRGQFFGYLSARQTSTATSIAQTVSEAPKVAFINGEELPQAA